MGVSHSKLRETLPLSILSHHYSLRIRFIQQVFVLHWHRPWNFIKF